MYSGIVKKWQESGADSLTTFTEIPYKPTVQDCDYRTHQNHI